MPTAFKTTREWRDVTPQLFRDEIRPLNRPAVLRGLVRDWPVTRAGLASPRELAAYLRSFDIGGSALTMFAPPAIGGRFFYNDDLSGLNFERRQAPIAASIETLLALMNEPAPPAVYVGAVPVAEALPGFREANVLPIMEAAIPPRVWLGNRVTVQTHFDMSENIACVVGGRRTFTMFPPEQIVNLYVGPLDFTLAGQPISMARLESPDFVRYPRFHAALATAESAELEPGDAIYVPYMWWHHVVSHDAFSALVNYWWDDARPWMGSPLEALIHALLAVRDLPAERRAVWREVFDHFIFQPGGEAVAHLEPRQRGILSDTSPALAAHIRGLLINSLSRKR
jgi:hypothetical protein